MIAIFNTFEDAEKFSSKCFDWLQNSCPNLNGVEWQKPYKHPDLGMYAVQVPQEWEKDFYPVKTEIRVTADKEIKAAVEQVEKLPSDWSAKELQK